MAQPRDMPVRHLAAFIALRVAAWVFSALHNLGRALLGLAVLGAATSHHHHHQADQVRD